MIELLLAHLSGAIMDFKGYDKFREKLPKYSGKRMALLGLMMIAAISVGLISLLFVDAFARTYPHLSLLVFVEPVLPILGVLMIQLIAFRLVRRVWYKREEYLEKLGKLAYQKALPQGFLGISLIIALLFHIYIPLGGFPLGEQVNPLTTVFSESFIILLGLPLELDLVLRICGSAVFIILGLLTVRSALLTFGIDYMGLVYLYHPAESEMQQYEIYSILRHPAYFGVLSLAMGGMILQLSVFSTVFFLMFMFGLLAHILFVEEKELEERFGQSFVEYKRNVPALHVRIRDLKPFIHFLKRRY